MILFTFGSKVLSLLSSTSKKSSISTPLVIALVFVLMALKGYAIRYYSTSDNDIATDILNDYTDNFVRNYNYYNNNPKPYRPHGIGIAMKPAIEIFKEMFEKRDVLRSQTRRLLFQCFMSM
ncbi:unnamed protein product [Oppiella nova]|uniref:Uncharacterized protein n=1 Tax=Oppiella nova TaxID=334625 RepID=A0A7R9LHL3_9ACAR|nr:unnamed protein product [Oppiella nova]CAG2163695.1 unnamed protein product [Oppiella nova]